MQTNAVLRKRAFRLLWHYRGMLWMIFILFALVNLLWYTVYTYLFHNYLLENILNIMYQLITASVMVLGLNHLLLRLIRKEEAHMTMLFDFVRSSKMLPKILVFGLIWQIPSLLLFLSTAFGKPAPYLAIFMIGVMLVAFLLIIWIMLRLFLFPYLFVTNPQESVPEMIKMSFRFMKGQVRHLLWFGITVCWWPFALLMVILFFVYSLSLVNSSGSSQLIRQLVAYLIIAILNPYFSLPFAVYANELLASSKDMR